MEYRYIGCFALILLTVAFFSSSPKSNEPQIARIVPDVSLSTTARVINIEGDNFNKDSLVYVGDHLLRRVDVASNNLLRARLPKDLDVGTYPVKVVSPGHRDVPASKLTIVPSETAPVVDEVSPAELSEGCPRLITIKGNNFRSGAQILLGRQKELTIHKLSGRVIEAMVSDDVVAGEYDLRVVNQDGECGCIRKGLQVVRSKSL